VWVGEDDNCCVLVCKHMLVSSNYTSTLIIFRLISWHVGNPTLTGLCHLMLNIEKIGVNYHKEVHFTLLMLFKLLISSSKIGYNACNINPITFFLYGHPFRLPYWLQFS
jgi:hypothetical protein